MASYKWIDRVTDETVSLSFIDEVICSYDGNEIDPKNYSPGYMVLTDWAMASLYKYGGGSIDGVHVQRLSDLLLAAPTAENLFSGKLVRFIFGQFKFDAWR